jgi:HK97 family phage prohead protease
MPYYIESDNPTCEVGQWATVKEDGEVMGCFDTKDGAIDQAVAISIGEDTEFLGERSVRAEPGELEVGDFVEWDSSGGMARGQIEAIITDGVLEVPNTDFTINATEEDPAALIRIYRREEDEDGSMYWDDTDVLVGHKFSTLTKIDPLEDDREARQVNLTPPAYMRASARRGLEWHREGLSGDGIVDATIREARAMAEGNVTADKWVRLRAWISRHIVDMDAPANIPGDDGYPGAGAVAMSLWGGGGSKRSAQRALEYANGVVARLEEENEGRAKGEALSKLETRINVVNFEIREDAEGGMTFTGYAAVFNSNSEPLPFTERIAPGAFRGSLKNRNDIKLLWNHDTGAVLGSTRAKTLKLTEDARGLYVEAQLPNTTLGRDARELIKRGDVDSMSFGFTVARDGESWSDDGRERTLRKINLHEVSIVAFPAYPATAGTATVRGLDKVAQRAEVDVDALADALLKLEAGEDITVDDRDLLKTVIDRLAPQEEAVEATQGDFDMLALKKKKLELLLGL